MSGVIAGYRYRLRVNPRQARQLQAVFDVDRFVWNMALGRWGDLWKHELEEYSTTDMCRELTDWRGRFEWLGEQPCGPQQQAIRDLGKAIAAYRDKTNPARRPRFKKKGRCTSARWTAKVFSLAGGRLNVGVAGGRIPLRVVWSRPLPSVPRSVTVYRDTAGRWWATFVVVIQAEVLPASGRSTGIDVGLNTYATTEFADSDVANPRFTKRSAKALARSQRNLARKAKGSKNRTKAKAINARAHSRVAAQREDFIHKQSRVLARSFDRIGVEALPIENMKRNRYMARAISDAAWGKFLLALDWQARKVGRPVVRIKAADTTQVCSGCGTKAKVHLGFADRIFDCTECGLVLCRDRNAARNLNPDRLDKSVRVGQGVEGKKSSGSADPKAA
ncbi:MAG: transposase [Actinomycetota bacterium]|nr:transposase [Actinomycetota bacterium]